MSFKSLFRLDSPPAGAALEQVYSERAGYENAAARFAWKPFHTRFRMPILAAKVGMFFFPILSIALGFYALFAPLSNTLPAAVAAVLAAVALGLLEIAKGSLLQNTLTGFFSRQRGGGLFLVSLSLSALSFVLSVHGARTFEEGRALASALSEIDSAYQKEIAAAHEIAAAGAAQAERVEAFRAPNGWLSAANVALQEQAIRQQDAAAAMVAAAKQKHDADMADARAAAAGSGQVAWAVAAGNELTIVLCLFFTVFADFRRTKEPQIFAAGADAVTVRAQDLGGLLVAMTEGRVSLGLSTQTASTKEKAYAQDPPRVEAVETPVKPEKAGQVGFSMHAQKEAQEAPQTAPRTPPPPRADDWMQDDFLAQNAKIVRLLLEREEHPDKMPTIPEIARLTRRSASHIYNVRRTLLRLRE